MHPVLSYIRASLDGLHGFTFLEIKFMGEKNFEHIQAKQAPLEHHWVQIQHQFFVTSAAKCVYVPYTLDADRKRIERIQYVNVKADPYYIAHELEPACTRFWNRVTVAKQTQTKGIK